jgi:hypothetical protein
VYRYGYYVRENTKNGYVDTVDTIKIVSQLECLKDQSSNLEISIVVLIIMRAQEGVNLCQKGVKSVMRRKERKERKAAPTLEMSFLLPRGIPLFLNCFRSVLLKIKNHA